MDELEELKSEREQRAISDDRSKSEPLDPSMINPRKLGCVITDGFSYTNSASPVHDHDNAVAVGDAPADFVNKITDIEKSNIDMKSLASNPKVI